jgi:hypothetical protein
LELARILPISEINGLADWNALMPGKKRKSNFDHALEALRVHSFEVVPYAPKADSVLVSKHGAAAILVADEDGAPAFVERPGALVRGEVARLLDRGYQKFVKTEHFEIPATASTLHAIHLFSEELNQAIGAVNLYNESLGSTSDLYQYDRLKGRQAGGPVSLSPWDSQGAGH